jgi:hypothetical protein
VARVNPGAPQDRGSTDQAARFPDCNPSSTWNQFDRNSIQTPEGKCG